MAKPYIEYHIKKFLEELRIYNHYFDVTFLEQERLVKAIQDRHDEIGRSFDYEHDDDCEVWSRAHEEILGSDEVWISEHELFIIGGYCMIFFHAFERFLEDVFDLVSKRSLPEMLKKQITSKQRKAINKVLKDDKLDTFACFCDIFPGVKTARGYKKVSELNIVCNVFKHGSGSALKRLKKIRPDITKHLEDRLSLTLRPFREHGLKVERKMIYEYFAAIRTFLFEVFDIKETINND